jgi:hypothetical protein
MESVPARLVLLNTPYSTLSVAQLPAFRSYRGKFVLRNLPPGTYRAAIERPGAQTLFVPVVLKPGQAVRTTWQLEPSTQAGNLLRNPLMDLRWCTPDAPDHWRYDAPHHQWISENIPVTPNKTYRAGFEARTEPSSNTPPLIELQWMSQSWQTMNVPPVELKDTSAIVVPDKAIYVRFAIRQVKDPAGSLRLLHLSAQ